MCKCMISVLMTDSGWADPRLWGVVMLGGKMEVGAKCAHVEISGGGTAVLTAYQGNTETEELGM